MNPSEMETSRIGSQSALDVRFAPENPFNRSEPIVSNPVLSTVGEQSDIQNVRKRKWCHNFTVPAETQSFHQYTDNPDLAVSNISSPSRPLWHRAGTASENLQQLESVTAHPTLNDTLADSTRDSPYLLDLHSWFNLWAMRRNIRVLTMTEQRVTPVNRHCSVLLVPEDIRGWGKPRAEGMESGTERKLFEAAPTNNRSSSYQKVASAVTHSDLTP
ncbi:hypothetical protein FGIG_05458 [Fasciola gigantica]|uniref:Uncharacterized protein n=1 Tax=Fasciola gigantica TaxID=46835 RepID=A0A504YIR0_FASGI|nr:hypothetical protein FGIG_05458 [Fasciola gigantica]